MLFALFNTLANFKQYINLILVEKFDFFGIVYLDDILIYKDKTNQIDVV